MLRIYLSAFFIIFFLGWILYRLFIKKDLNQNINIFYLGLTFTGIWVLVYYLLLK